MEFVKGQNLSATCYCLPSGSPLKKLHVHNNPLNKQYILSSLSGKADGHPHVVY